MILCSTCGLEQLSVGDKPWQFTKVTGKLCVCPPVILSDVKVNFPILHGLLQSPKVSKIQRSTEVVNIPCSSQNTFEPTPSSSVNPFLLKYVETCHCSPECNSETPLNVEAVTCNNPEIVNSITSDSREFSNFPVLNTEPLNSNNPEPLNSDSVQSSSEVPNLNCEFPTFTLPPTSPKFAEILEDLLQLESREVPQTSRISVGTQVNLIVVEAEVHAEPTSRHQTTPRIQPSTSDSQLGVLTDQIEFLDSVEVDDTSPLIGDFTETSEREGFLKGVSSILKSKVRGLKLKNVLKKLKKKPKKILQKLKAQKRKIVTKVRKTGIFKRFQTN